MKELAPEKIAKQAGLIYLLDTHPGFKRGAKTSSGFRYFTSKGLALKNKSHLKRIKSLVIPPAWTDVWISPLVNGHLQATGRDARGRKQYRYHPEWNQSRNENKYSKMIVFAKKLPHIRARLKKDLKGHELTRPLVLASIVKVMEKTLIRIGNEEYAKENSSFGLTTLRNKHAQVKGQKIAFKFVGKSGLKHDVELADKKLATIVRKCQELPGQDLFGYIDDHGKVVDVTSTDVNEYLTEITGEKITAKDFRTWGGTVKAAIKLRSLGPQENKSQIKKALVETAKETAQHLRNTVAVCRKYYIHPCIFSSFEKGTLFEIFNQSQHLKTPRGLKPDEIFTLKLLEKVQ